MAGKGGKSIWEVLFNVGGKADPSLKKTFADARKGIDELKKSSNQLGTDFKSFVGNASKLALGIAGGVTAATKGIITMATSVAEAGDKAAKTAGAIGIGIEAYQELQYAMQQSGLEAGEFDGALTKFNNTVRQGAAGNKAMQQALANVGLSASKLAKMPTEQAFSRISDYMKALPNDAERSAVAITLFGKTAGPKLMAAMKDGSAGINELMQEARDFGIVMTDESARQSEEYLDNIMRMKTAAAGLKTQFISGALGPLTEAFGYLKDTISDNMPAVQDLGAKFGKWAGETVKRIPEVISKVKGFGKWVADGVNKVKDFAGGWKNVAKIAGGVAVAPTFISGLKTAFSLGKTVVAAFKTIGPVLSGLKLVAAKSLGGIIISAAPVIAVVAGIAAAAYLIVKNWDKVKPVVVGVFNKIKGAANTVIAAMKAWWEEHGEKVTGVIDKIGGFIGTVFTKAQESVGKAIEQISAWWDEHGDKIMATIDNIRGFIGTKFNEIQETVGAVIAQISAWWDEHGEELMQAIERIFGGIIEFITGVFTGDWSAAFEGIKNIAGGAIDFFAEVFGDFLPVIAGITAGIVAYNAVVKIMSAVTAVQTALTKGATVAEIAKTAAAKAGAAAQWLLNAAMNANPIGLIVAGIAGLVAVFVVFWNKSEAFRNFWIGLWDGIKAAFKVVVEFFSNAIDNIIEFLQPFLDAFKRIFGGVIEFFTGIFTGDWERAINGIKEIFGGIVDYFKAKIELILKFFQPLLDVFGAVGDFVGGTFKKVGDFVGGLFGGGKSKEVPGHADGGIFAHRHIAEIAEKGAEAVIPLNNTERGRRIWEQAGQMGGYAKSAAEKLSLPKSQTPSQIQAPSIIERAAGERMTGGDSIVIHFNQSNTFGGTPDSQTIQQIEEAGRSGAKDLEDQFNEMLHNRHRVSYAAYTKR